MKRPGIDGSDGGGSPSDDEPTDPTIQSKKQRGDEAPAPLPPELGEDLVFEVLRRADARTLAAAACVSRRWRTMAEDERLWEALCTRHCARFGCGERQLRAVVLALGGFRRLHALYLQPLLPAASAAALPTRISARWGRDEVQLSLSLLSIGYFEKMNGFKYGGSRSK